MSRRVVMAWMAAVTLMAVGSAGAFATDPGASPAGTESDAAAPLSPRLEAWRKLGFGMFVHWGLYSELGGVWQGKPVTKGYSEQIQSWAKISHDDYAKVAESFTAKNFDADAICALAKEAGASYLVVTSKHHDGFAMFATKSTDFNVVERTPFAKDPLRLLSDACRKIGLGFGVYFSLVDWHAGHPFDPDNNNPIPASMEPLIERQLRELMTNYGPIVEVWFDMSAATPEQSRRFKKIVRELQPQAAVNGRIWNNEGDFVTLGDNEAPPPGLVPPFETPASIYHETWGYRSWQRRDDAEGKIRELVRGMVQARTRGGNYLLNIGPKGDGSVVPFEAQVLRGIGAWLQRHPHAVDGAQSAQLPAQSWGEAARCGANLCLFVERWSVGGIDVAGLAGEPQRIVVDGGGELRWHRDGHSVHVDLPPSPPDAVLPVLRVESSGPLQVMRENATAAADGVIRLPRDRWNAGTSFGFRNGYATQYPTRVVLSAAVSVQRAMPSARLSFHGLAARRDRTYRIAVGERVQNVAGEQLAKDGAIAVGDIPASTLVLVSIRLADPAYAAEDIGLSFVSAELSEPKQ